MPNEPRRQVQDLVLTCAEPQQRAAQENSPRTLTISTMTTSTFVAGALTSAHVGAYVWPEDGNPRGNARQITKVVLATTTATVDAPWQSTTNVTTLRSWLPSEIPARSTATGTTTALTSSPHQSVTNEPTAFWASKGYYLLSKTTGSSNLGGAYKVNSFTTGTGVFDVTGDAFVGAPADGDLFLLRKVIRPEQPVTVTSGPKTITRRIVGFKAADQAVPVTADGSIEVVLAQRPLTASAGNSVAATPPFELGEILADFMTQALDTGSTFASQSGSAPALVNTLASGAGFTVGGFALMGSGEASQVSAISTNALTMPNCTAVALLASGVAYASAWYQFKTSDFRTRTWDLYRGRLYRQCFHGCVPTVELSISRDQVVKFTLKYTAGETVEYNIGDPNTLAGHKFGLLDTTVPVDGKGARFTINYTPVLVGDIKINFGVKPVMRPSLSGMNQTDGVMFDLEPVTVAVTGYLADNDDLTSANARDLIDIITAGDPVNMFYQKGTNPKETFCWSIPAASLNKSTFTYDNAQGVFNAEFVAVQPQAMRGNSFGATLPDFAMGWL